jgi:hypothetical protein
VDPDFNIDLEKGENGLIIDDSEVEYKSPKTIDFEGDKITIEFDLKGLVFISGK